MDRSTGRRIQLGWVVEFNNLCSLKELRSLLGQHHREHRRNGEVRGNENIAGTVLLGPLLYLSQALLIKAGGSHHAVNSVGDAEFQVPHNGIWLGKVHDDLCVGVDKLLQIIIAADFCHQL